MSADNTIIIAQFDDGFRVEHGGAAENLQHMPDYHGYSTEYLQYWFGNSKVYLTESSAMVAAKKLYNEIEYVEYGICPIKINGPFPKQH